MSESSYLLNIRKPEGLSLCLQLVSGGTTEKKLIKECLSERGTPADSNKEVKRLQKR